MEFMELIDLLMILSYFGLNFCIVLLVMSEEIRTRLYKLQERFYHVLGKKTLEHNTSPKSSYNLKTVEERRREALDYLVEKYFESKKREEEYLKKLKSYGKIRKWAYTGVMNLKGYFVFVKEALVKPFIIAAMTYSTYISIWFGMKFGSHITGFTQMYVPTPINHALDVLILFPIGFSPGILSIILTYYIEKRDLQRILKIHGPKI